MALLVENSGLGGQANLIRGSIVSSLGAVLPRVYFYLEIFLDKGGTLHICSISTRLSRFISYASHKYTRQ